MLNLSVPGSIQEWKEIVIVNVILLVNIRD